MGKQPAGYRRWAAAVERGGLGHTAAAWSLLEGAAQDARRTDDMALLSLTRSTTGSLWRQAGRHAIAYRWDGRALAVARRLGLDSVLPMRAATVDALVGLAADNLGLGRFSASARLLARARAELDRAGGAADDVWEGGRRQRLRIEWVSAELAMYSGDPTVASEHATRGERIAAAADTPERHRVKTRLIRAAAAACADDSAGALELAREVTGRAAGAGLLPLEWASWALRAGLDPDNSDTDDALRRTRAALVAGGVPFMDG